MNQDFSSTTQHTVASFANEKNKSENTTDYVDKNYMQMLHSAYLPLFIFVLKRRSDEEHAIHAPTIFLYVKSLFDEVGYFDNNKLSVKTVLRTLQHFIQAKQLHPDDPVILAIEQTFGGTICCTTKTNAKNAVQYYYFEPFLDATDISLIQGSILSNQFLSQEEKNYLKHSLLTISSMTWTFSEEENADLYLSASELPGKPLPPTRRKQLADNLIPQTSSLLLSHLNQLQDAIENKYCIDIIYGHYDVNAKTQICFQPTTKTSVTLNPYAILWDRGHGYLLATNVAIASKGVLHYRIDRLISIHPHFENAGDEFPMSREIIPPSLSPYFATKKGKRIFQPELYLHQHPHMGIYEKENLISCQLACTSRTIAVLIDYFGHKIQIQPAKNQPDDTQDDVRNLVVTLDRVQYENIKLFCLSHLTSVRAIAPKGLVDDIKDSLQSLLTSYETL